MKQKLLQGSNFFLILLLLSIYSFSNCSNSACGPDKVFFGNKSSHAAGVLVDGLEGGSDLNDLGLTTAGDSVEVGELDSSTVSNRVIGFNEDRSIYVMENANWSDKSDTRVITFDDPVEVPVAVWIVFGNYNDRFLQAYDGLDQAWLNFYSDAVGLDLTLGNVIDATGYANISNYYDFTATSDQEDWKTGVGFIAGQINIYLVHTVDGETWKARAPNFRDVIVYGETAVPELMVHEIGHTLSLHHTDTDAVNFDSTNVMWPLSALYTRDQFTEGQIFRLHTDVNSSLNWWIAGRPGLPQYDCPHSTSGPDCPLIYKRVWADNTFQPN